MNENTPPDSQKNDRKQLRQLQQEPERKSRFSVEIVASKVAIWAVVVAMATGILWIYGKFTPTSAIVCIVAVLVMIIAMSVSAAVHKTTDFINHYDD